MRNGSGPGGSALMVRGNDHMLSLSEMLLIMTMFHNSAYKDFKHYFEHGIKHEYAGLFGQTLCYARVRGQII